RRDRGADLRHPRHGPIAARRHQPARLSDHHRRQPVDRLLRHADQSGGRSLLRPARSQGEIPLMTLAIDIPASAARKERNGVIRSTVRVSREKPLGAAGGVIFVLFLLCGICADVLAPYGMNQISPRTRLLAPSWAHWFGTDNLGRDMLSRCLYGAQISVIIA